MRPSIWLVVWVLLLTPACQEYSSGPDSGQPEDDGETIDPGDCCGNDEPAWHDDIPWYDDDPWTDDGPQPQDTPADGGPIDSGPIDGGPTECPQVGGAVIAVTDCIGPNAIETTIEQFGCEFTAEVIGIEVKGYLEPNGAVFLDVDNPLGLSCEGRIHRAGFPFGLSCGDCGVWLFPDKLGCWGSSECPPDWSCQRVLDQATQNLTAVCEPGGGPNTNNTGEACQTDGDCHSLWCYDYPSFCTAVCLMNGDCPDDMRCATRVIELDLSASGEMLFDWMNLCTPFRRECETNADCRPEQFCELIADPTTFSGFVKTCGQEPGAGWLGMDCGDPLLDGCATGICVTEGGYCSQFCRTDQDCLSPTGEMYQCRDAPVEIWPGYHLPVRVCAR